MEKSMLFLTVIQVLIGIASFIFMIMGRKKYHDMCEIYNAFEIKVENSRSTSVFHQGDNGSMSDITLTMGDNNGSAK
jgi:hypothetical protein